MRADPSTLTFLTCLCPRRWYILPTQTVWPGVSRSMGVPWVRSPNILKFLLAFLRFSRNNRCSFSVCLIFPFILRFYWPQVPDSRNPRCQSCKEDLQIWYDEAASITSSCVLQRSARSRAVRFNTPFTPRMLGRHANESFWSNAVETANRVTRWMGSLCGICLHRPTVSQLLLRFHFYTTYSTWYVSIRSIQYDGISYSNDSPHCCNPFESRKIICTSFNGVTLHCLSGRPPLL